MLDVVLISEIFTLSDLVKNIIFFKNIVNNFI